jgi:hypothetical protein
MAATLALHHLVLLVLAHSQRLLYILLFFIYRKNIKKILAIYIFYRFFKHRKYYSSIKYVKGTEIASLFIILI